MARRSSVDTSEELRAGARGGRGQAIPARRHREGMGYARRARKSGRLGVTTRVRSFLVTLLVIIMFISVVYGSGRLGLIAIISNALPSVIALGGTRSASAYGASAWS